MAAALQAVCVFAVFWCAALRCGAGPAVRYDQRQQGEFNLQVDMDDVAIVLLPGDGGGLLDRRNDGLQDGGKVAAYHQMVFGRRNRIRPGHSRKKHKKPTECGTTPAVTESAGKPQVPEGGYGGGQSSSSLPSPSPAPAPLPEYPAPGDNGEELSVVGQLEDKSPASPVPDEDDELPSYAATPDVPGKNASDVRYPVQGDPYSVTPGTPDIVTKTSADAVEMVAVKTVDRPVPDVPESVGPQVSTDETKPERNPAGSVIEPPAVSPPDAKTVGAAAVDFAAGGVATEENKRPAAAPPLQTADKPAEMIAVKTVEKPTFAEAVKVAKKPAAGAGTAVKTVATTERIAGSIADGNKRFGEDPTPTGTEETSENSKANVNNAILAAVASADAPEDKKKTIEPVEMVAMKTVEKPTFAESLKVVENRIVQDTAAKAAAVTESTATVSADVHEKPAVNAALKEPLEKSSAIVTTDTPMDEKKTNEPVEMVVMKTMEKPTSVDASGVVKKPVDTTETTVSVGHDKKPTEMIAMKTIETPSAVAHGSTDTVEKSGITASTKPLEIQEDKKSTSSRPVAEIIVSRSAPKPSTEMVAVKTVENPATVTTIRTVTSVKTVIKPGTPKTTLLSNGSSTMRKVADRKPLPMITLEVATPKVVYT